MMCRAKVLSLYKALMRTSAQFENYNFRTYALRRVQDAFHDGRSASDPAVISGLIQKAEQQLEVVKRQTTIGQMYRQNQNVLEAQRQSDK